MRRTIPAAAFHKPQKLNSHFRRKDRRSIRVKVETSGKLEGKSIGQKKLILLPLYFIGVLILNLLWPNG